MRPEHLIASILAGVAEIQKRKPEIDAFGVTLLRNADNAVWAVLDYLDDKAD